jgi:outer membrane protein assembly factor BamB
MPACFNPPPGWPVRVGWTPPPGWTPEPGWPPAPDGWQFWIDDDDAPAETDWTAPEAAAEPVPARIGKTGLRVVAAVATVVAVAATAVVTIWWNKPQPAPAPSSELMLAQTYPTAPQPVWTVNAERLAQGDTTPHFFDPKFGADVPDETGAIVTDDQVITFVRHSETAAHAGDARLTSFRLSDGAPEWSAAVPPLECAPALLGNTLPCLTAQTGQQSTVGFIDVSSGATTATATVPFDARMITTDGRNLYTAGYVSLPDVEPQEILVAKGSPQNPLADWKTAVPLGDCSVQGEFSSLLVGHGLVWGSYGGGAYAVLRDHDGSALFDHPVTGVTVAPDGSRIAAASCAAGVDPSSLSADVYDGQGRHLFAAPTPLREPWLQVYSGGPAPFVTQDGAGLDPTTGAQRWRSQMAPDGKNEGRSLIGNALVGGVADGVIAVDIGTGQTLWTWTRPHGHYGFSKITDGQRLLLSNEDGGVDAVNLDDGHQAWSISGTANEPPQLYSTPNGLLTVSATQIQLLSPTGPAAVLPPLSGNLRAAGGTRLVTKCGQAPEFQPEAVHTEDGALVIRMKIVTHCPGGDVLSGSQTRLSVTSGGQTVADGIFDLSSDPVVVSPESASADVYPFVEHEFRFPAGTFAPVQGGANSTGSAPQVGTVPDVRTLVVACIPSGSVRQNAPISSAVTSSHTATGPGGMPGAANPTLITFDSMRDFVTSYYGELPAGVDDAWSKLDPHLAERNGRQDYLNWWSGVQSVEVSSISPRDDTSVQAHLQYHLRNGNTQTEDRWLSFVAGGGGLRIYDSDVVA